MSGTRIFKVRSESDSSSAGVVQLQERDDGGMFVFNTWDARGEERRGGKSLMNVSVCLFPVSM